MKRETILHALEHIQSKLEEKEIVAIQESDDNYKCPLCEQIFTGVEIIKYGYKYCYRCGQRVDFTLPRNEIKEEEPKLYNGKVVCVESKSDTLTKGKIYNVVNGVFTYDNGEESLEYKDFEDIQASFFSEFIEVTGEQDNNKLYTGRVLCVDEGLCEDVFPDTFTNFTLGKIYNVNNGIMTDDLNNRCFAIKDFEDIELITDRKFVEITEEK